VKTSKLEDENFDYKEKIDQSFGKIVCAYANTNAGRIIVGVSKKGKIVGTTQKEEEKATNIMENCKPPIKFRMKWEQRDGKHILIIDISKSDRIHTWKGIAYKRSGSSSTPMNVDEIVELSRKRGDIRFDDEICKEATLDDIDDAKVAWFLRKAKFERNFDVEPETPGEEALERLKLIKGGKLTNASILLFGENPSRFFMQAETRCARFKGTKPLEFIDMKVFGGNVIDQRDDAVEFVKEHIKLHAKIVGTERVETWEYPIEAVREAITNAICHRDYEIASNVQIRIFDDRIEIWGCGPLPKPLTVEDLKGKHDSVLRNPLICKSFFLIKYIEQWGTGTNRIIEECLNHGLPEPLFEEITGSLVITFRKYRITEETLEGLNERKQNVVNYLIKHGKITNREYRQLNPNVTDRTALNDFNELIKKNILLAKGEKKYRYYVLR
jgi:ATP-dependent DNA helicase RecG